MVEDTQRLEEIQHPTVRAAFDVYSVAEGVELHHDGDLPARSGIGSSAAFSVGLVHAIRTWRDQPADAWTLAKEAIYLEQEVMQEVGGSQDQVTCALGGVNRIDFQPSGEISALGSPSLNQGARKLNSWLVLLYTGAPRSSSEVSEGLLPAITDFQNSTLHRTREIVDESTELLRRADDESCEAIGRLLHESWNLKRDSNPRAVTPQLANLYDRALSLGALGGKVSGAGGGGFMLFCVHPDQREHFITAMSEGCLHVPFRFVDHGSQVVFHSE